MSNGPENKSIHQAAELIEQANNILFVTGAGVSAESGLPTYRGVGGLYNDGNTPDGISIEEAISGPMMKKNPELSWKYLYQIEESARGARFNRAHEVMAMLEKEKPRVWVLTQNVDSFHTDAGSSNVIEIHGNFRTLFCTRCSYVDNEVDYRNLNVPPICPDCGSILRPDVVLFGEMLPEHQIMQLRQQLNQGFDLVVSAGTSSVFPYIMEPVIMANRAGKPTIEINPSNTDLSQMVTVKIDRPAAEALNEIYSILHN